MEVSDQIIKVLDNLGQKFGLAVDWTQSNIAPYVQQLGQKIVNYELWTSVVWITLMIIFLIGLIISLKKSIKGYKNADRYANFEWIFLCIFSTLGIVISVIVIITQVFDIVTCLTLPEKIWMDYINSYMNRKQI